MEDSDYAYALSLQYDDDDVEMKQDLAPLSYSGQVSGNKKKSLVDPEWELIDPNPNIYTLFAEFNKTYFWNSLMMVEVRWSPRMTLCAGICCYERRGGLCSVRLSQPLLKLRPRKDLVETLLHEMIHAYLFVTDNNKDHDGHGPEFCRHMHRINKQAGTNISIYHSFHDEVAEMRKHWWRCTGPCQNRPPYFGYVKRAMNREPSWRDFWWSEHQKTCGGAYAKIKEPEGYGKKKINGKTSSSSQQAKQTGKGAIGPKQTTLKFEVKKSPENENVRVVGGLPKPLSAYNRGIPSHSRLLDKFRTASQASTDRKEMNGPSVLKDLDGNLSLPAETLLHPKTNDVARSKRAWFENKDKRKRSQKSGSNLAQVCQEVRRTGRHSVNRGAEVFFKLGTVTKFLTSKEKKSRMNFTSDDEFSEDEIEEKKNKVDACIDGRLIHPGQFSDFGGKSMASTSASFGTLTDRETTVSTGFIDDKPSTSNCSDRSHPPTSFQSGGTNRFKRKIENLSQDSLASLSSKSPRKKRRPLPDFISDDEDPKILSQWSRCSSDPEEVSVRTLPGFSSFCKSNTQDNEPSSSDDDDILLNTLLGDPSPSSSHFSATVSNGNSEAAAPSSDYSHNREPRMNSCEETKVPDVPDDQPQSSPSSTVQCPLCNADIPMSNINYHLDDCLSVKAIQNAEF